MSPTASVRAARHETTNPLSSKRRQASAEYLRDQEHARIRQIRSRARKERNAVCKLQARCTTPSARHLLKQALQTLDLVDRYFLAGELLQARKAPAQLAKWFDFVEQCLESAVKKREFYETMLERYCPTETLLPDCAGHAAKSGRQQRSGARLVGPREKCSSGGELKVQTARRSRGREDDEAIDSRPLIVATDTMSISVRSRAAGVQCMGGSNRSRPKPGSGSNRVSRKTILTGEAQRVPHDSSARFTNRKL
jgi:hypothetical protein